MSECKAKRFPLVSVCPIPMPSSACLQIGAWNKVSVKLWSDSRPVLLLGGLQNSASRSQGAKITLKRKPAKAHHELLWPTVDHPERSRICRSRSSIPSIQWGNRGGNRVLWEIPLCHWVALRMQWMSYTISWSEHEKTRYLSHFTRVSLP